MESEKKESTGMKRRTKNAAGMLGEK